MNNKISFSIRHLILDDLMELGYFCGICEVQKFIEFVYPKVNSISVNSRKYKSALEEIRQHMVLNNDWKMEHLLYDYFGIDEIDDIFLKNMWIQ